MLGEFPSELLNHFSASSILSKYFFICGKNYSKLQEKESGKVIDPDLD